MRGPPHRRRRAENAPVAQSDRQGVVATIGRRRAGGGGEEGCGAGAGGGSGGGGGGGGGGGEEGVRLVVWMPVLEGGVRKRAVRKMRMRICAATKESYTLLSKKR